MFWPRTKGGDRFLRKSFLLEKEAFPGTSKGKILTGWRTVGGDILYQRGRGRDGRSSVKRGILSKGGKKPSVSRFGKKREEGFDREKKRTPLPICPLVSLEGKATRPGQFLGNCKLVRIGGGEKSDSSGVSTR